MPRYELLSVESDAKTIKGSAKGYLTGVLYLAPANEASDKVTMCPRSTGECRKACLYGAGMAAAFPSIKRSRIAKTMEYIHSPEDFAAKLAADVSKLVSAASKRGLVPAVRVNGTSDMPKLARKLAAMFPDVQFYDYSKIPKPWTRLMSNYHLTFSHAGDTNLGECLSALQHGVNVAVVFSGDLPSTWHGYQVVNGDLSDLRFLDPSGVIVGLRAKGEAKRMEASTSGFIQIS